MNELKKAYFNIKLSDQEIEKSWQNLKKRLTHARPGLLWLKYSGAALSLIILFFAGIVGMAQAAEPGTTLYPVKILSDKIAGKILNKPEISVEKRAKEVIEASEPKKVEEADREYHKALDEAEREVKKSEEKKKRLNEALGKQEEKFKEAIKENPKSEKKLEKALVKTQDIKEKLEKPKNQH